MDIVNASVKIIWAACALVVGLVLFLLVVPKQLDASAKQNAETFCNSIIVGESIQSLSVKAETAKASLASWEPKNGLVHHQAWFSGFLANAFSCEIYSQNGKVISNHTDEHTW